MRLMKKFFVISHTHWDREWYMPFEAFRLKLVDLIDHLLEILEKKPDYVFHLDAQTVVLEDYLEIRPQKKELLKKYISSGNVIVGPWYLQNDFYYTSGEATIRNLLLGRKTALSFGACSGVGYAPDQFGNIAQLPQILNGFGIDNFIFGRGWHRIEKQEDGSFRDKRMPSEFIWQGKDGSRVVAICLKHWYNNAQHIPAEPDLANLLLDINEKNFEGFNVTPYILLMNGVDHLEPQADVTDVISALRKEGRDIVQTSLDEYVHAVTSYIKEHDISPFVYEGAIDKGADEDVLKGCRSSRVYLKSANVRSEDLLQNKIEPLYAYLEASGMKNSYPADEIAYLWKLLMKNHPHDSICGCSRDEVHLHMEDNFRKISEAGGELLARGEKLLTAHVSRENRDGKDYFVAAFNPTETEADGTVTAELYVPEDSKIRGFALFDRGGREIPYEMLGKERAYLDAFSPLNLPGVIDCTLYTFRFESGKIPPFSHAEYLIKTGVAAMEAKCRYEGAEDDYYRILIHGNTLIVKDKRTGNEYADPVYLTEETDRGDAYIFRPLPGEKPTKILPSRIVPECREIFEKRVKLQFEYDYPDEYVIATERRSGRKNKMRATVVLTLSGSGTIGVRYELDNVCKDHKTRLNFDFGVTGETLVTDFPFGYSEVGKNENGDKTADHSACNSTFCYAETGSNALALYTEGQHEALKTDNGIALAIVRSTGYINKTAEGVPVGGRQWAVPENQCLRKITGRVGLSLGKKTPDECFRMAKVYRNGLIVKTDCYDPAMYSRGRFAVQSAELARYYFSPDPFGGKVVPAGEKFGIEGKGVVVTSFRVSDGKIVLRAVNFAEDETECVLKTKGKIERIRLDEEKVFETYDNEAKITLRPMQIATFRFDGSDEDKSIL